MCAYMRGVRARNQESRPVAEQHSIAGWEVVALRRVKRKKEEGKKEKERKIKGEW